MTVVAICMIIVYDRGVYYSFRKVEVIKAKWSENRRNKIEEAAKVFFYSEEMYEKRYYSE